LGLTVRDLTDPVVGFNAGFTGRYALINSTNDTEKDTYQFRASINYNLPSKPTKLSIGGSFLNGSDPYTALENQQYFLISFNVFLKK